MGKLQLVQMELLRGEQPSLSEEEAIVHLRNKINQVLEGYCPPS